MIADVTEARADELNRMIAARPKDSTGACAAQPAADYFYDADNLRSIKRLWSAGGTQPLSFTTTVRGGLDGLSDITTHVSDGLETKSPYEQKNYVYGPGGLIASEKRVLYASSNPAWQLYGTATGCTVNNPAASAEALNPNGYDLALNFGACASTSIKTMTLEWHELNADGTPKDCTNQRIDTTTNFNARYNCGLLHLNPALGTSRLYKLKYASTSYGVKVTETVSMGLYGSKSFVVSQFTASLAKGQPATALAYADQTPAPPAPGGSLAAPGPGGREVNYYQKDHLGTVRVVSDESGNVLSTHDYEPFGLELPSQDFSFNTHRFTGHERDTETGLDYMKARYFGASMGRFGAVDEGIDTDIHDSSSWNSYLYTRNDPISFLDADGKLRLQANQNFNEGHYTYEIRFYSATVDSKPVRYVNENVIGKFAKSHAVAFTEKHIISYYPPYKEIKGTYKAAKSVVTGFNNHVVGKEVRLNIDLLGKSFDQKAFERDVEAKFNSLLQEDSKREIAPTNDTHQYPAVMLTGSGYDFTDRAIDLLQQAVNDTVDGWVSQGKLTPEEGANGKAVYDIDKLREEAQKASKDYYKDTTAQDTQPSR